MRHIEDRDLGIDTMGYDEPPDNVEVDEDGNPIELDWDLYDTLEEKLLDQEN